MLARPRVSVTHAVEQRDLGRSGRLPGTPSSGSDLPEQRLLVAHRVQVGKSSLLSRTFRAPATARGAVVTARSGAREPRTASVVI